MRLPAHALVLLALFAGAGATSCITETAAGSGRPRGVRTSGFIVSADVDSTWTRVRSIVQGMTSEPLMNNGVPRSIRTTIQGAETTILVEARDSQSTAVHVNSKNPQIVNRIQSALR